MFNKYICALDIGSSKIAAAVAQIKNRRIRNVFFETNISKGIKRGAIINSIDLVSCLTRVLKNLENKSGINIKSVYSNISGEGIVAKHSRAIIPLAERGNKVITLADIQKVNEQARILGLSLEEEIIHAMPFSYAIDSKNEILNPLGLYSHRLEVDLYLVCGKLSFIQSLTRAINQAGYEIKDLFFSGIATSKIALGNDFKKGINILCDIGSDKTELLFFNDGLLREIKILPVGGDDLTQTLSETLKIPFELAEDVKRSYGVVGDSGHIKEDKEILLKNKDLYKPIKQKLVVEIITNQTQSLCQTLKEAIEGITPCFTIDNFVISGRAILLEGFLEKLEETLRVSVKTAKITQPDLVDLVNRDNALSGRKYLNHLTTLGILCQALYNLEAQSLVSPQPAKNLLAKMINKFKETYQEYF